MTAFIGTTANDTKIGTGSADQFYLYSGNDVAYGGLGVDDLFGDGGNDRLYGGDSNDRLYGGTGDDVLYGGAGEDRFYGGTGLSDFYGGSGRDTFSYNESGRTFIRDFDRGWDKLDVVNPATFTLSYTGGGWWKHDGPGLNDLFIFLVDADPSFFSRADLI